MKYLLNENFLYPPLTRLWKIYRYVHPPTNRPYYTYMVNASKINYWRYCTSAQTGSCRSPTCPSGGMQAVFRDRNRECLGPTDDYFYVDEKELGKLITTHQVDNRSLNDTYCYNCRRRTPKIWSKYQRYVPQSNTTR